MSDDTDHCAAKNFTLLPRLMSKAGYRTAALGKWDVGWLAKECTPSLTGFDVYLGYYEACLSDYWYHWSPEQCNDATTADGSPFTDLSNSTRGTLGDAARRLNGTYNARIFTDEAIRLVDGIRDDGRPLFLYLAYQNVHLACGHAPKHVSVRSGKPLGLQAPCGTVDLYANAATDTVKLQGAFVTELDYGVGNVTAALRRAAGENYVVFLVSDNGAQLDHGFNAPHRGGKHTFWEGGVRVVCWINSPLLPKARRGTQWSGLAHSSDWYVTLVAGLARAPELLRNTGPRVPDGVNLWPALVSGGASPRNSVVHQVSNRFYNATTGITTVDGVQVSKGNGDGCLGTAIRIGRFKLILGDPGDRTVAAWPPKAAAPVAFGKSGGERESGTDHCRAPDRKEGRPSAHGIYLFDLIADPTESANLADDPAHASTLEKLRAALAAAGLDNPLPPAYIYMDKASESAARAASCAGMVRTGYMQPADATGPVPPSPPPAPGPPSPAAAACAAAGGILDPKERGSSGHACCTRSCGQCGGSDCGDRPGGNADCCGGAIHSSGRQCGGGVVAPCMA